jgi:hypothetical protein
MLSVQEVISSLKYPEVTVAVLSIVKGKLFQTKASVWIFVNERGALVYEMVLKT